MQENSRKISAVQPVPQFLPETLLFGFRLRQLRADQDRVHSQCLDVRPGDDQSLVPAQQPKQMRLPEQQQAFDLRRCRIELQIIGAAKAGPVAQLNDLLCAQLPEFYRDPLPAVCLFHPMRQRSA